MYVKCSCKGCWEHDAQHRYDKYSVSGEDTTIGYAIDLLVLYVIELTLQWAPIGHAVGGQWSYSGRTVDIVKTQ